MFGTHSEPELNRYLDVASVENGYHAHPFKRSKMSTVCTLLDSKRAVQEHENELVRMFSQKSCVTALPSQ